MGTIFSATDMRGRIDDAFTTEYAWTAGKAFAEWLVNEGPVVVAAIKDANTSIAHAFVEGVLLMGRDVVDCGESGQVVVSAIISSKAAGGVIISHDGVQNLEILTFYDAHGSTVTADNGLTDVSGLIDSDNFLPAATKGNLTQSINSA